MKTQVIKVDNKPVGDITFNIKTGKYGIFHYKTDTILTDFSTYREAVEYLVNLELD